VIGRFCRSEGDAAWVRAFAEARPAPVLVTAGGRGVLPDPHPLVIGLLGGGEPQRRLLASADLVVAVGLDALETNAAAWPPATAILHLSRVPPAPDDRAVAAVVGDVGLILEELAPRLRDQRLAQWDVAHLHALKQAADAAPTGAARRAAHRMVEEARRLTPPHTIAVFDAGPVLTDAARAWRAVAPGECLTSTAGEGFAVPAAVAAQLERPAHRVICFTRPTALRDRGLLELVARLTLPVLIIVLGELAETPSTGLRRFRATAAPAFAGVFDAALTAGVPALIEVADAGEGERPEEEG
jgi:thiamine pyrophosphate-dependent acetolactate synthase large subunit-like protein